MIGIPVIDGGAGGNWKRTATTLETLVANDDVKIDSFLRINGSADTVQQIIKGNATQTANLQEWQDSLGTNLAHISPDGSFGQGGVDVIRTATAGNDNLLIGKTGNTILTGNENIFIGKNSGANVSALSRCNGFGFGSLQNNTGLDSSGFGHASLQNNTGANSNGFGNSSLINNTGQQSNGFGYVSLQQNSGNFSNGFGTFSLQLNSGAFANGIGYASLQTNAGANSNGFGAYSLRNNTGANSNAFGHEAFLNNSTGTGNNTGIGHQVGYNNLSGSGLVLIGHQAGYDELGSNKLHIANNATQSLIYGEFDNKLLISNGQLEVVGQNDTTQLLVKGNATQTANLQEWQDSIGTNLAYVSNDGNFVINSGTFEGTNNGSASGAYFYRTDGKACALAVGTSKANFRFDDSGSFGIQAQSRANLDAKSGVGLNNLLTVSTSLISATVSIDVTDGSRSGYYGYYSGGKAFALLNLTTGSDLRFDDSGVFKIVTQPRANLDAKDNNNISDIIEISTSEIKINSAGSDIDYSILKSGGSDAYKYDAGLDIHTFKSVLEVKDSLNNQTFKVEIDGSTKQEGSQNICDKLITVHKLEHLPTPAAGVITLAANTTYLFLGTVDLAGNRLVGGQNTTLIGESSEVSRITSTGLGVGVALFTTDYTTPIQRITFENVDTAIDIDGARSGTTVALDWSGVNFKDIPNIGTIGTCDNWIYILGAFLNAKGLRFTGTVGTIGADNSLFSGDGAAGSIIEIASTATVTRRFRISYSSVVAFGSTTGITVDAAAGIPNEGYILDNMNFAGGGTYTAGVLYTDDKARFKGVRGIPNTGALGAYSMINNATATVISAANTPTKILGTTTANSVNQRFSHTDNQLTYTGSLTRYFKVDVVSSFTGGNNKDVSIYIAKNGVIDSSSQIPSTTDGNGKAESVPTHTMLQLVTGDTIEVFIENNSDSTNIIVGYLNLNLIEVSS